MSQISKRYIPEKKLSRIFELFFDLILSISDKGEAEKILGELLTSTEKTMMAKRVTCFYLLLKGIPWDQIEETVKLSTSTIAYFKHFLDNSPTIKNYLSDKLKEEKVKHLFEDIFVEFFRGMPRKGSNWSMDKKIYHEHKRKREEGLM